MAKAIVEVRGIGPATAELLAGHGFRSAEDLAVAKIEQLAAVKGFSEIRATQVVAAAKALFAAGGADAARSLAEPKKQKAPKGAAEKQLKKEKKKKEQKKSVKKKDGKAGKNKKTKDKKSKKADKNKKKK